MAMTPAPDTPVVAVRETTTQAVSFVSPLDAKEYIASGAYALAPDVAPPAPAPKEPRATHPPDGRVALEELNSDGTVKQVVYAFSVDATEMVAKGPYRFVPVVPVDASTIVDTAPVEIALPEIDQLATALASITDVDALLAMDKSDERHEAKPIYEQRFTELANAAARH